MRVRLLTSFRDGLRGHIRDWPEEQCEKLIAAEIAEPVDADMDAYFSLLESGVDADEAAAKVWGAEDAAGDIEADGSPHVDPDHPAAG